MRPNLLAALITLTLLSPPCLTPANPKSADPAFAQINSIVQSLSAITGLSQLHTVPYGRMSKHQLHSFLTKRIKKTLKPGELYADELSLKMFGLVPQDFDLKKSTIDLLTEQAAAFYDYDEKKLFLLEDSSFAAETTTLAHELSHALADQHFNLNRFMEESPANDDENLAHTAVVEGQATWLMLAYDLKQNGRNPVPTPDMLKAAVDSTDAGLSDYPVLKASPLYIQQSLLFPYSDGTAFFHAVYQKMGKDAFAAVFTNPPSDTSQILHPDQYFAHLKPLKPALPKLPPAGIPLGGKIKEISEGSVGEFDHLILLRQFLGDKAAATFSGHLRGGQFQILTRNKSKHPILLYASQWDTEPHAAAFFAAYQKILLSKWKSCHFLTPTTGQGDNGYFSLTLTGTIVTSTEGLESPPGT
jgi:hypothetical protein